MTQALVLALIAHRLGRDLQSAAKRLGGARQLADANQQQLRRAFNGDDELARRFATERDAIDVDECRRRLEELGAWVCALGDDAYPPGLAGIVDPPFGLVGHGGRPQETLGPGRPRIALVGSRRPTRFGRQFAHDLARDLAERDAVIVSGLALGIDAAGHEGALAGGGATVAVLGSGIAELHPRAHRGLRDRIVAAGGTVCGEYWVDTRPAPWRFPARNRIVAGVVDAVVIVEAAERSGALITADFALEGGIPVLAVPGRAGAVMSAGCHTLIRAGAGLCESAADVVDEVPHRGWRMPGVVAPPAALEGIDAELYAHVLREPARIDDLVEMTRASPPTVIAAVGRLELAGLVQQVEWDRYAARR